MNNTIPANPLANPRMLASVIVNAQFKARNPSELQRKLITAHVLREYPDATEDSAEVAIQSVADSVVLSDEAKLAILTPIKDALKSGDITGLRPAVPQNEPKPESHGRINPLASANPLALPINMPAVTVLESVTPAKAAAQLLEAFTAIARGVTPTTTPALDEERVKEIADGVLAEQMAGASEELKKMVTDALEKIEAAAKGTPQRLEISLDGSKVIDLGTDPRHFQFEQVFTWLSANCPVWLWGKAGSGKTHMARQLAKALDLPVTIISIDPTMTVGKLVGFRSLANGEFVEGFLLQPFRDGGVVMLDEIDTGDPGILACLNALIANGHYTFPNGETVERHKNFRIIAGANTKGTGAVAGYTARQKLDAATLNRFAVIELEYDERLEEILTCGTSEVPVRTWTKAAILEGDAAIERRRRWVRWVRKVRQNVGSSVLVSPRASYLGVAALDRGIPLGEIADALVFALVTSDTKQNIISACGGLS